MAALLLAKYRMENPRRLRISKITLLYSTNITRSETSKRLMTSVGSRNEYFPTNTTCDWIQSMQYTLSIVRLPAPNNFARGTLNFYADVLYDPSIRCSGHLPAWMNILGVRRAAEWTWSTI